LGLAEKNLLVFMGQKHSSGAVKDKGVRYRVVRAQCAGTGETTDVECRPVDLQYETKPGAPPPLRPDPTAFVDDSGARGSAIECALTADFPNDSLISLKGHRDWVDADVKSVMVALQQEESYSGVERFLFIGWVQFIASDMDSSEDRVLIVTSYGRVYAVRCDAMGALVVCGGGPGVDHALHVAHLTNINVKSSQKTARLEATFSPPPGFVVNCTVEQADEIVKALRLAKMALRQGPEDATFVKVDRKLLPVSLSTPPDGGFYASYLSHANAQGSIEPSLILTDKGEQTLLR